ncbi:mucin-16-like isoform X3 [Vombatus ursinus]|uniref:mucin-16-like isoform X3 n=1 Tax=Vombatus ursinus TaxID=29139 RepID=UPI000FFDBEB0|nr:mucin-16-like isoform X3 [Vombatus ursinus]
MSSLSSKITAKNSHLKMFPLNFTITNMFYTEDMGERGSNKFNTTKNALQFVVITARCQPPPQAILQQLHSLRPFLLSSRLCPLAPQRIWDSRLNGGAMAINLVLGS